MNEYSISASREDAFGRDGKQDPKATEGNVIVIKVCGKEEVYPVDPPYKVGGGSSSPFSRRPVIIGWEKKWVTRKGKMTPEQVDVPIYASSQGQIDKCYTNSKANSSCTLWYDQSVGKIKKMRDVDDADGDGNTNEELYFEYSPLSNNFQDYYADIRRQDVQKCGEYLNAKSERCSFDLQKKTLMGGATYYLKSGMERFPDFVKQSFLFACTPDEVAQSDDGKTKGRFYMLTVTECIAKTASTEYDKLKAISNDNTKLKKYLKNTEGFYAELINQFCRAPEDQKNLSACINKKVKTGSSSASLLEFINASVSDFNATRYIGRKAAIFYGVCFDRYAQICNGKACKDFEERKNECSKLDDDFVGDFLNLYKFGYKLLGDEGAAGGGGGGGKSNKVAQGSASTSGGRTKGKSNAQQATKPKHARAQHKGKENDGEEQANSSNTVVINGKVQNGKGNGDGNKEGDGKGKGDTGNGTAGKNARNDGNKVTVDDDKENSPNAKLVDPWEATTEQDPNKKDGIADKDNPNAKPDGKQAAAGSQTQLVDPFADPSDKPSPEASDTGAFSSFLDFWKNKNTNPNSKSKNSQSKSGVKGYNGHNEKYDPNASYGDEKRDGNTKDPSKNGNMKNKVNGIGEDQQYGEVIVPKSSKEGSHRPKVADNGKHGGLGLLPDIGLPDILPFDLPKVFDVDWSNDDGTAKKIECPVGVPDQYCPGSMAPGEMPYDGDDVAKKSLSELVNNPDFSMRDYIVSTYAIPNGLDITGLMDNDESAVYMAAKPSFEHSYSQFIIGMLAESYMQIALLNGGYQEMGSRLGKLSSKASCFKYDAYEASLHPPKKAGERKLDDLEASLDPLLYGVNAKYNPATAVLKGTPFEAPKVDYTYAALEKKRKEYAAAMVMAAQCAKQIEERDVFLSKKLGLHVHVGTIGEAFNRDLSKENNKTFGKGHASNIVTAVESGMVSMTFPSLMWGIDTDAMVQQVTQECAWDGTNFTTPGVEYAEFIVPKRDEKRTRECLGYAGIDTKEFLADKAWSEERGNSYNSVLVVEKLRKKHLKQVFACLDTPMADQCRKCYQDGYYFETLGPVDADHEVIEKYVNLPSRKWYCDTIRYEHRALSSEAAQLQGLFPLLSTEYGWPNAKPAVQALVEANKGVHSSIKPYVEGNTVSDCMSSFKGDPSTFVTPEALKLAEDIQRTQLDNQLKKIEDEIEELCKNPSDKVAAYVENPSFLGEYFNCDRTRFDTAYSMFFGADNGMQNKSVNKEECADRKSATWVACLLHDENKKKLEDKKYKAEMIEGIMNTMAMVGPAMLNPAGVGLKAVAVGTVVGGGLGYAMTESNDAQIAEKKIGSASCAAGYGNSIKGCIALDKELEELRSSGVTVLGVHIDGAKFDAAVSGATVGAFAGLLMGGEAKGPLAKKAPKLNMRLLEAAQGDARLLGIMHGLEEMKAFEARPGLKSAFRDALHERAAQILGENGIQPPAGKTLGDVVKGLSDSDLANVLQQNVYKAYKNKLISMGWPKTEVDALTPAKMDEMMKNPEIAGSELAGGKAQGRGRAQKYADTNNARVGTEPVERYSNGNVKTEQIKIDNGQEYKISYNEDGSVASIDETTTTTTTTNKGRPKSTKVKDTKVEYYPDETVTDLNGKSKRVKGGKKTEKITLENGDEYNIEYNKDGTVAKSEMEPGKDTGKTKTQTKTRNRKVDPKKVAEKYKIPDHIAKKLTPEDWLLIEDSYGVLDDIPKLKAPRPLPVYQQYAKDTEEEFGISKKQQKKMKPKILEELGMLAQEKKFWRAVEGDASTGLRQVNQMAKDIINGQDIPNLSANLEKAGKAEAYVGKSLKVETKTGTQKLKVNKVFFDEKGDFWIELIDKKGDKSYLPSESVDFAGDALVVKEEPVEKAPSKPYKEAEESQVATDRTLKRESSTAKAESPDALKDFVSKRSKASIFNQEKGIFKKADAKVKSYLSSLKKSYEFGLKQIKKLAKKNPELATKWKYYVERIESELKTVEDDLKAKGCL